MLSPWGTGRSLLGDPSIGSIRLGLEPVVRNGRWVRRDLVRNNRRMAAVGNDPEAEALAAWTAPRPDGRGPSRS
jgi:hypothetical protein